jgi:hypothetical protein
MRQRLPRTRAAYRVPDEDVKIDFKQAQEATATTTSPIPNIFYRVGKVPRVALCVAPPDMTI